jgi:hypothetical protein
MILWKTLGKVLRREGIAAAGEVAAAKFTGGSRWTLIRAE